MCSDHYAFSLRIPFIKITMQTIDKLAERWRPKITEGQKVVRGKNLVTVSSHRLVLGIFYRIMCYGNETRLLRKMVYGV